MTRSKSKLSSVVGSGRAGQLRRRTQPAKPSGGVSKQAIRRLARRAGVKRMSEGIYTEAPLALRAWLSAIVKDAVVYADHARRFTLTVNDIILALKRNGSTLYGYTYYEKRERLTRKLPASALAGKPAANEAASGVRKASTAETPSRAANLADGPAPAAPTAAGVVEQTPKGVLKEQSEVADKDDGWRSREEGKQVGWRRPEQGDAIDIDAWDAPGAVGVGQSGDARAGAGYSEESEHVQRHGHRAPEGFVHDGRADAGLGRGAHARARCRAVYSCGDGCCDRCARRTGRGVSCRWETLLCLMMNSDTILIRLFTTKNNPGAAPAPSLPALSCPSRPARWRWRRRRS